MTPANISLLCFLSAHSAFIGRPNNHAPGSQTENILKICWPKRAHSQTPAALLAALTAPPELITGAAGMETVMMLTSSDRCGVVAARLRMRRQHRSLVLRAIVNAIGSVGRIALRRASGIRRDCASTMSLPISSKKICVTKSEISVV
jgi:hypothetical protein